MRFNLMLVCFCCSAPLVWAQQDKPPVEIIAVVGAELRICEDQGTISNGVVLIQGDTILAVGDSTLVIPAGAQTIDAKGCVVTPGLIDARSKLWLASDSANAVASDASLDIVDGIDPYSENWHEVLNSGVTAVYLQPSSKGTLGGYGAVVSVMPKTTGEVAVLASKAGLQASIGVSASSNRVRQQELERTKKILDTAIEYRKKWEEYEAYIAKQAKEPSKDSAKEQPTAGKSKEKPVKKPDRDPAKEELLRVIKGEIPLRLEVNGPDDVAFAMKLFEGDSLKSVQVVFEGLNDLRSAGKVIRDHKNPIVLGPWLELEQDDTESNDSARRWGADFATYDGAIAIASNGKGGQSSKLLRAHAAKAISFGFSQDRALKSITIDAARVLGVSDRVGSLAKGKRADLACFRGEPTNPANSVVWVMSGGKLVASNGFTSAPEEQKSVDNRIAALRINDKTLALIAPLPKCFSIKTSRCWLDGLLQPAVILVCDGKIVGITKEGGKPTSTHSALKIPDEFDVADAVVTPGLVSGHSNFGLDRIIDPQLESDASLVVAADAFARDFNGELRLVRNGLLRALLAPGSSNPISGSASLIRIGASEPSNVRDAATKFVLSNSARNPNRFPSSLSGQIQMVSQSLKGTLLPSRVYLPSSIEQGLHDRRVSTLRDVASGKRVAIIEAHTDAEILSALQLIEAQKLNAFLLGPKQLKTHFDRIQKSKSTIVVQPLTAESFDWYLQDIVQAAKAGIPICFAGESAEQLRLTAAMIVAAGADHDQMLAALCEVPKALSGLPANSGMAVGGPADLVIWSGSPLNLGAKPLHVLIDGQVASKKDN